MARSAGPAESLRVAQSAVSASLAALQRSVGLQLVARHGRGLRLTEAGQIYVDYAERALGLLDAGKAAAAGELAPRAGTPRAAGRSRGSGRNPLALAEG